MNISVTQKPVLRKGCIVVNLVFTILIMVLLFSSYIETYNQRVHTAGFEVKLLENTLSSTFDAINSSLQSIASDVSNGPLDPSHLKVLTKKVNQILIHAAYLTQLVIISQDEVVVDTQNYFKDLKLETLQRNDITAVTGKMYIGSVLRGRYLPLTYPNTAYDSEPKHIPIYLSVKDKTQNSVVIIAAFNPSYFYDYIASLKNNMGGSISILDGTGESVLKNRSVTGNSSKIHELHTYLIKNESQERVWPAIDTLSWETLFVRKSLEYPFTAIVVINHGDIFVQWLDEKLILILLLFSIVAALQVASFFVLKANRKALELVDEFRLLSKAVENSPSLVLITDSKGVIQYVNRSFEINSGFYRAEIIGSKPSILKSGETSNETYKSLWASIKTGKEWKGELHNKTRRGDSFWVRATLSPLMNDAGKISHFIAVEQIITQEKHAQDKVRLASTVFNASTEGIMVTDTHNIIQLVNRSFEKITGYKECEVIGKKPKLLQSGKHDQEFYEDIYASLNKNRSWGGEIWNKRKTGELYPQWITISQRRDENDELEGYVALFSDITERKKDENLISYQANYDTLTNLPNRHLFKDRLQVAIRESERRKSIVSLLFIDLDRFKIVNDNHGHAIGDLLLKKVAQRLLLCTRKVDTVARLGGDEFVVIVVHEKDQRMELDLIAKKILLVINDPFYLEKVTANISCSIGIASYPINASNVEELLSRADVAMYKAKSKGKNTHEYYNQRLNKNIQEKLQLEKDIHSSLQRGDFYLVYQPINTLDGQRIESLEALIRWNHPSKGLILPDQFISLAEETGQIYALGAMVIEHACIFAKVLATQYQAPPTVSINISPIQFKKGDIDKVLKLALQKHGVCGTSLVIEITESILLENDSTSFEQLNSIVTMGAKVSIDDFGTGYSSLSYLEKFPISGLKVDRSFIKTIVESKRNRSIVEAMISMSESLEIAVVIEGVESEDQLRVFHKYPNLFIQGYLFSQPLSEKNVHKYILGLNRSV